MNILDQILNRFLPRQPDSLTTEERRVYNNARRLVGEIDVLSLPQACPPWKRLENGNGVPMNAYRHIRSLRSEK
jgi:hypothetical protein